MTERQRPAYGDQAGDRIQEIKDRLAATEAITKADALYLLMKVDQLESDLSRWKVRAWNSFDRAVAQRYRETE